MDFVMIYEPDSLINGELFQTQASPRGSMNTQSPTRAFVITNAFKLEHPSDAEGFVHYLNDTISKI